MSTTAPIPPAPTYTLVLKPLNQADDPRGIRRLRAALKNLLRGYRLRVLSVHPTPDTEDKTR
jgi:hypothetical protein